MHDGSMERQQLLHYEEILRNADQFVTVQRRALLKYLLRHRVHPTTAQIASAVGRSGSASLATVYNNLALFAELAIVRTCAAPAARSTGTSAPIAIITWSVPTVATSTTYPKNRLRRHPRARHHPSRHPHRSVASVELPPPLQADAVDPPLCKKRPPGPTLDL